MSAFHNEDLLKPGNLEFLARQVVEGFITGLHKSPFHGFSVEFAEHRLYNSGESVKNIDWKLYARSDKLFTKRYEEETNLRCLILMDVSSSMYYPDSGQNKIKFSALGAASLMYLLKKQRDAVGLCFFSESIDFMSEIKSAESHHRMLIAQLEKQLLNEPLKKQSSIIPVMHEIAEKLHKRSLVVIFSDMLESLGSNDELYSALQHLKFNKHEVVLFHTLDKSMEIDFRFENRPYIFEDVETGERLKLFPSEVQEKYVTETNSFIKELKNRCRQYKIDFTEADVALPIDQVLLPFLVKRQKMRG
ncbi:MAG: DUF58 domain-containing protein [Flavobacteriales bacterium]|nr:DUF58 domain-containing protein [Flavobacteriales bacterium]